MESSVLFFRPAGQWGGVKLEQARNAIFEVVFLFLFPFDSTGNGHRLVYLASLNKLLGS